MIIYHNLVRVRRELENIFLLMNELEDKGVPKDIIVDKIIHECKNDSSENAETC